MRKPKSLSAEALADFYFAEQCERLGPIEGLPVPPGMRPVVEASKPIPSAPIKTCIGDIVLDNSQSIFDPWSWSFVGYGGGPDSED